MGKKKDKLYKLEPETKAMIAAVRSAVEDCAATGLYGRFMGFEESHTTDDYRLTAVFDCGEYRLRLRYLPSVMLLTDNFLDIDLDYGDVGRFTLYDVFNVLEIEDFNQYYHMRFFPPPARCRAWCGSCWMRYINTITTCAGRQNRSFWRR